MQEFNANTRREAIDCISDSTFDVIVIGGGITGAGSANALSSMGLKVLLLERGDFASGTSSASSKLIHGGLRYLQQGRILLTRDLINEREYLLRNTDIVKRIDFRILIDQYSASRLSIKFGLFLYSILSGKPKIPRFVPNNGEYPTGIKGHYSFYDAVTDDSSLVIYNVMSAKMNGAVCLNYCEVTSVQDGDTVRVDFTDLVSKRKSSAHGKLVVNCGGPWADNVLSLAGKTVPGVKLSGGTHIVLDRSFYKGMEAVAFFSHIDGRQMFIIPREKVVIVGTTDIIASSPENQVPPEAEIEYLVHSVQRIISSVNRESVLSSFYGTRPLLGRGKDPGKITRNFKVVQDGKMLSVYGVKLTDYRRASRKVASLVSKILGISEPPSEVPEISYSRPHDVTVEYLLNYECPITIEDVTRRRNPVDIYDPLGKGTVVHECETLAKRGKLLDRIKIL